MKLHLVKFLRRPALALFSRLNPGDVTIRHHWTGDPVQLHSYKHKGYWYHGRSRERWAMEMFARLIHPGDTVIEVGGHIGYVALWLSKLVGPGKVYVFEPGPNNLPYIQANVRSKANVTLVAQGLGDTTTERLLYVEELTGLNNTCVENSPLLASNAKFSGLEGTSLMHAEPVQLVRFDDFARANEVTPDFIKIDVEGFESEVLQGMQTTLHTARPKVMVEVTRNRELVWQVMREAGYVAFGKDMRSCVSADEMRGNLFCLQAELHRDDLTALGVAVRA
jgi:FkbM family methyltransferase